MARTRDKKDVLITDGPIDPSKPARAVRVRPEGTTTATIYPLKDGRPLPSIGQIADVEQRVGQPGVYDVEVKHHLAESPGGAAARAGTGPGPGRTDDDRDGWERTFGKGRALS